MVGNGPSGVAYGEGFVGSRTPSTGPSPASTRPATGRRGHFLPSRGIWDRRRLRLRVGGLRPPGLWSRSIPAPGQVVQSIAVGVEPSAVATGAGAVWVANRARHDLQDRLVRLGAGPIRVGSRPDCLAADSRRYGWRARATGHSGFDPLTGERLATSELGNPRGYRICAAGRVRGGSVGRARAPGRDFRVSSPPARPRSVREPTSTVQICT